MKKLLIPKSLIKKAANQRAKEVMGAPVASGSLDKNLSEYAKVDFTAGVEWAMTQLTIDHGAFYGHELITKERMEQIIRGYDAEHDDRETHGQLPLAAALYALEETHYEIEGNEMKWPWPQDSYPDKRGKLDRVRQLTIAGALIAAEIDRQIRAATPKRGLEVTYDEIRKA